jgi:hypothetical protein
MPVIWQHARYLILPPLSRQTVFDLVRPQHLVDVWAITSLLVFVFVPRWTDSATAHVWASLIYAGAAPLIYGGIAGGLALGVSARAGRDTFIMRVPVRVVSARRGCDHARAWDGNSLVRRFGVPRSDNADYAVRQASSLFQGCVAPSLAVLLAAIVVPE